MVLWAATSACAMVRVIAEVEQRLQNSVMRRSPKIYWSPIKTLSRAPPYFGRR
jgi:hypothetical protein